MELFSQTLCGSSTMIYLDHNATTPMRPAVKRCVIEALDISGNPSSIHSSGRRARAMAEKARGQIASSFGVTHENIIFTKSVQSFIKKFIKFLLGTYKGKIVAISGSVGKTTTKENIYHILNNNQFKTYRSFKNFNNILGLQFSIMNMDIDSKFAVFELGINAPKEMDNLIKILQPHYSLLTAIEDSHIGNFKNFSNLFANKIKIFNSKRLIKGLINIRNDNIQLPKKIINKVKRINLENLNIKAHKHDIFVISFSELFRPDSPRWVEIPESDKLVLQLPLRNRLIHAPTAALIYQFREIGIQGNLIRTDHIEEPVWAWK